jgi:hypothetical protein
MLPASRLPGQPARDSNFTDLREDLENAGVGPALCCQSASTRKELRENRTVQLAAREQLEASDEEWLGVRDDFRNWIIEAL